LLRMNGFLLSDRCEAPEHRETAALAARTDLNASRRPD